MTKIMLRHAYEGKKDYRKMIDAMMTLYEKSEDSDYIRISTKFC